MNTKRSILLSVQQPGWCPYQRAGIVIPPSVSIIETERHFDRSRDGGAHAAFQKDGRSATSAAGSNLLASARVPTDCIPINRN